MGNTVQSANPKATANQCQHEEGSLVEQTRVSFFCRKCSVRLVSFTNGTLWDSPTKMAPYRWPRYYKGEHKTLLLIVMFEYIVMATRLYPRGNVIQELDTC